MINVVCGVVRNEDGRVLACRRSFCRPAGGLWEFPGGKVEDEENSEDALERELLEELGIVIEVEEKFLAVAEWEDAGVELRLSGYECVIVGGELVALEHEEIRWCELGELERLEWAEPDLPILAELLAKESL
ncbi:MAG: NUDIX domain-containing protein [Luteolibacter sp.]